MIRTRTISITSGKGGVGKTTITCNLAHQLAKSGRKVLILDGDLGMANVDVFFGIKTKSSIFDVITQERRLEEVMLEIDENLFLIPGGSGLTELQALDWNQRRFLLDQMNTFGGQFDYLLVDTAPGISDNVLGLNLAVQEIVLVITPDPASFTDAYALLKVLNQRHACRRFVVLSNMVKDLHEGFSLYRKFSDVTSRFLDVSLDYLGAVPLDLNLRRANQRQSLVVKASPFSPSSVALSEICRTFGQLSPEAEVKGGFQFFWQALVGAA